jgi:sarcosine dehydrogenase
MADLTFTKLSEQKFYIAAGGSTSTHDWRWITSQLEKSGYNASLRDATDEYCMLSVQGPFSRKLLKELVDQPIDDDSYMPFSTARHMRLAGHELMALRLTFVGELGYELHVPSGSAVAVYEALMQGFDTLAAQGVKVSNAGYRAIDTLSAEKGYRHWHADLTNRDTPFEAGIGFVALAKLKTDIPFLGREALEKQRAEGLKRKLVCLTLDEKRPSSPLHGRETIWRNDECIGFIRSTAFGFSIGKQIAYGYVDAPDGKPMKPKEFNAWLKTGTFTVGDRSERRVATLEMKAPFDPSNARIKGEYAEGVYSAEAPLRPEHTLDPIVFSEEAYRLAFAQQASGYSHSAACSRLKQSFLHRSPTSFIIAVR